MIEEGDLIWTLMVSYLMQNDTDDDRTTSDGMGGGSTTHATWNDRPYYRPSGMRGSKCLSWRRRPYDALEVVVTKVKGKRDDIKGLVEMMMRDRTALHGRRDHLLREGKGTWTRSQD